MMECTITITCLFRPLLLTKEVLPHVKPSVNDGRAVGRKGDGEA
jgi:hypothetical protein